MYSRLASPFERYHGPIFSTRDLSTTEPKVVHISGSERKSFLHSHQIVHPMISSPADQVVDVDA